MDYNSNNMSNNKNNNNSDYISRIVKGIIDVNSIRPAVTPESIPSFLTQSRTTNKTHNHNFNSYYNTILNSSPTSQESDPSVKDSMSENFNSENEGFNKDKIKKTEIPFHDSDSNANSRITISNKKTEIPFHDSDSNANSRINMSNKKIDNSNSDPELSSEKITKSNQFNIKKNAGISNLNKSDRNSSNLKLNNLPDISYKTKIMPEAYISNKNNIDFERILYSKNANNRLQKNQTVQSTFEPSITINIGKITVRYIDDNHNSNRNSKNIKDKTNGTRNSNKLSLADYLKKRSETFR